MLSIGDKILVDTLSQKGPFWAFADLKGENKAFFAHPFHASCAAVRATFPKQRLPQL